MWFTWQQSGETFLGFLIFAQWAAFRFDAISFLMGVIVGVLVWGVLVRTRPYLSRTLRRARRALQARRDQMRSGVEGRYRENLAADLEAMHMMHQFFPLSKCYVPFRLIAPSNPETVAQDRSGMQIHYIWPHLTDRVGLPPPPSMSEWELLHNGRRVLIVGQPGTGKSTLLAQLALRCLQADGENEEDAFLHAKLPVHLHLAELAWRGSEYDAALNDPLDAVTKSAQQRLRGLTGAGLGGVLREKAKHGELHLFLDGWDRLAIEQRRPVARWVEALCKQLPEVVIFLVAGQTGYGLLLEQGFTKTGILPWRMGQAGEFAATFGRKLAFSQLPQPADYWQPGQPVLETVLRLHHFQQRGRAMSGRPALPAVFETGLNAFSMNAPAWWGENTRAFWSKAAYLLLTSGQMSLVQTAVDSLISDFATLGVEVDNQVAQTLRKSLQDSGMFLIWQNGALSFRNNLVRDFLAAYYLYAHCDISEVQTHLADRTWTWVLKFYVALRGGTELATPMLRAKDLSLSRKTVFRAASWMPLAKDEGEWRRQVMVLLGQMIRASSFTLIIRQRAVAALVMTGEPGVNKFINQLLERSDPFLRHLGVLGLAYLAPGEKRVEQLTKMLGDTDPFVRRTAVYALAPHQYDPAVEEAIVQALLSEDETVSRTMAEMLALNGAAGIDLLREAVEDKDVPVRRSAVYGLASVGADWVEPLLIDIERHDGEWVVRNAATSVLEERRAARKRVMWRPVQPAKQRWLADYALANGRTVPNGAAAMPYLVQILGEGKGAEIRAAAAALLGQLPARGGAAGVGDGRA
jgi:energy-coupling factor transporter ATP-binding protein EcfA2